MKYDLQAKIEPVKRLKAVINVTATPPETATVLVGSLIPHLVGCKDIVGNLGFPHILIDSEGYKLIDNKGYTLLSAEPERSEA